MTETQKDAAAFALGAFLALLVFGLFCSGCSSTQEATRTVNHAQITGHALADVVIATCQEPYERAAQLPEADAAREVARLDALRCPAALHALTAYSNAHRVAHDLIEAIDAGQCVATIARDVPEKCDLIRALKLLVDASTRLTKVAAELKEATR